MKWIKLLEVKPEDNKIIKIKVSNKTICLVNHENEIRAFKTNCPHAGGDLSNGWCDSGFVVCPLHRYKYNLENGLGAEGQGDYLKVYPLEMRTDGIYIGFKKPWWSIFRK